jgi:prepilin peptidase CpaA
MPEGFQIVLWLVLLVCTVTDLLWGKIYNVVTLPTIALGVGARFFVEGHSSALTALSAVGVAFALFFPLYLIKTLAAGDVKLLMALGAWSDSSIVLKLSCLSIIVGALVGAVVLLKQRGTLGAAKSLAEHLQTSPEKSEKLSSVKMQFAPAFLAAFLFLQIAALQNWRWL